MDKLNPKFIRCLSDSIFKPFCIDNLLALRNFLVGSPSGRVWTLRESLAIAFVQHPQFIAPNFMDFRDKPNPKFISTFKRFCIEVLLVFRHLFRRLLCFACSDFYDISCNHFFGKYLNLSLQTY